MLGNLLYLLYSFIWYIYILKYNKKLKGNGRVEAMCSDGQKRLCHIRGKMRKKVWIQNVFFINIYKSWNQYKLYIKRIFFFFKFIYIEIK